MFEPPRRARSYEYKVKVRLLKMGLFTVIILLVLVSLGPKAMVQFSVLSEAFKKNEPTQEKKHTTLLPPNLDPLPKSTKNNTITVSGNAPEATVVEVYVNDVSKGRITMKNDRSFSVPNVKLKPGTNVISAVASNANGQESPPSETQSILYKDEPPLLEISQPTNDEERKGNQKTVIIKGKTDPDTEVYINDRIVIVGQNGEFEYPYKLEDGQNSLHAVARDSAGNETEVEITVKYSPS